MNIKRKILESIETKLKIANSEEFISSIHDIARDLINALRNGNKILIAGNGGSAADAQHFAAEIAGKFVYKRTGLPAVALTTNTSILTAISNDFGYENIFSRQIEAIGNKGDIFIGISTSGNSENIIKASATAVRKGLLSIGLIGSQGGIQKNFCQKFLIAPSSNTQYVQESHIMIIHLLCYLIDEHFKE